MNKLLSIIVVILVVLVPIIFAYRFIKAHHGIKGLIIGMFVLSGIIGILVFSQPSPSKFLPALIGLEICAFAIAYIIIVIKSKPPQKTKVNENDKNSETSIIQVKELPTELLILFHTFFVSNEFLADQNMSYNVFAEIFLRQKLYTVLTTPELRTLFNMFRRCIQKEMNSETWLRYFYKVEKGQLSNYQEAIAPKGLKLYGKASLYNLGTFQKDANPSIKNEDVFLVFEQKVLDIMKKRR